MWYILSWGDYLLYSIISTIGPLVMTLLAVYLLDTMITPFVPVIFAVALFIHVLSYFKRHESKDKQGNVIVKTTYHKLIEVLLASAPAVSIASAVKILFDRGEYTTGLDFIWNAWWIILILNIIVPPVAKLWRSLYFKFRVLGIMYIISIIISAVIFVFKFL